MLAPDFWSKGGAAAALLSPLGAVYAWGGRLRQAWVRPRRMDVPVICVGNLVAGGAGKTPVALSLAQRLRAYGIDAHIVTRGYGGKETGPLRVDRAKHTADDVGDEPLLLAADVPTWVARQRPAGARAAISAGAKLIVLDDGHQNPSLIKDLSLVVVDGSYGIGNGRVIPAGPLREPVAQGLARASVLVILGDDRTNVGALLGGLPVLRAQLVPGPEAAYLRGRDLVAFAGIGRPEKFFDTLTAVGGFVRARYAFPDHHPYTHRDIAPILRKARELSALPVTTAKDAVRLPAELRHQVRVLSVDLAWDDLALLDHHLAGLFAAADDASGP